MTPVMTASDTARLTALIRGRVQGVGYRAFVRRRALDLKISGYVENLPDGRVEVVAEGERSELEHLLVLLREGPPHADVEDIDITWSHGGAMPRGFYVYG
jgi:acylphosphatase